MDMIEFRSVCFQILLVESDILSYELYLCSLLCFLCIWDNNSRSFVDPHLSVINREYNWFINGKGMFDPPCLFYSLALLYYPCILLGK